MSQQTSPTQSPADRGADETAAEPQTAAEIVETIDGCTDQSDGDRISVQEFTEQLGNRAFAPLLFSFAFIALLPLVGGIPGVSLFCAAAIFLIAVQMVVSKSQLWLPGWIGRASLKQSSVKKGLSKGEWLTRLLDKATQQRWQHFGHPPWSNLTALACALLALTMIPLNFIPYAVTAPVSVIVLLSLGLAVRDGVLICAGWVFTLLSVGYAAYVLIW